MEVIFMVLVFLFGTGSIGIYMAAPEDWNKTISRAAQIARANMGGKAAQAPLIRPTGLNKTAMAIWEAQYEGKGELVVHHKELHTIVKSWNQLDEDLYEGTTEKWFWRCGCGTEDYRKSAEAARNAARRHVNLYKGRNEEGVRNEGWLKGRGL